MRTSQFSAGVFLATAALLGCSMAPAQAAQGFSSTVGNLSGAGNGGATSGSLNYWKDAQTFVSDFTISDQSADGKGVVHYFFLRFKDGSSVSSRSFYNGDGSGTAKRFVDEKIARDKIIVSATSVTCLADGPSDTAVCGAGSTLMNPYA